MYDILPFPNITATDEREQVAQINNYLIQLKESLEFALMNISADNLSQELRTQLNSLGAEVKTTQEEQTEATQQLAKKISTVSADCIVSGKQTTTSTEDGGENVYTFTRVNGVEDSFVCRNGSKGEKGEKGEIGRTPTISMEIDFTTGQLTYTSS